MVTHLAVMACLLYAAPELAPRPGGTRLWEAKERVEKAYRTELRDAKRPCDKSKLAKRLLRDGEKINDDPAIQFVIYCTARDMATASHDWYTALEAVSEIAKRWSPEASLKTPRRSYLELGDAEVDVARKENALNKKFPAYVAAANWYIRAGQFSTDLEKREAEKKLDDLTILAVPGAHRDIKLLIGVWHVKGAKNSYDGKWRFYPDGTATGHGEHPGFWRTEGNRLVIRWTSGAWESFERPIHPAGTEGISENNTKLIMVRVGFTAL